MRVPSLRNKYRLVKKYDRLRAKTQKLIHCGHRLDRSKRSSLSVLESQTPSGFGRATTTTSRGPRGLNACMRRLASWRKIRLTLLRATADRLTRLPTTTPIRV
jgi:hypothetical protein